MAKAGSVGFLYEDDSKAVITKAIEDIVHHGYFCNSRSNIIEEFKSAYETEKLIGSDLIIVRMICDGKTYKEIGSFLCMSDRTVEVHVKKLCVRFHVSNCKALTCKAFHEHWNLN